MITAGIRELNELLYDLACTQFTEITQRLIDQVQTGFMSTGEGIATTEFYKLSKLNPVSIMEFASTNNINLGLDTRVNSVMNPKNDIKSFRKKVDRYMRLLLAMVHLTSGAPARGTELLQVRYRKTATHPQGVFNDGGSICFVTEYDKTMSRTEKEKVILRWPVHPVGRHVLITAAFIHPILDLQSDILKENLNSGFFFYDAQHGKPYTTQDLTDELKRLTSEHLGAKLKTSTWRQVAVAIAHEKLKDDRERSVITCKAPAESIEDQAIDFQAAHTTNTAYQIYALRSDLGGANVRIVKMWRGATRKYQNILWPSGLNFGTPQTTPLKRSVTASVQESSVADESPRAFKLSKADRQEGRSPTIREIKGIFELTGGKSFKSNEQAAAYYSIIDGKDMELLVVLPTGGGKSLLYQLPLKMEVYYSTILVIPYRSLQQQVLRDCASKGLKAVAFDENFNTEVFTR
jgi:hypothetical protein